MMILNPHPQLLSPRLKPRQPTQHELRRTRHRQIPINPHRNNPSRIQNVPAAPKIPLRELNQGEIEHHPPLLLAQRQNRILDPRESRHRLLAKMMLQSASKVIAPARNSYRQTHQRLSALRAAIKRPRHAKNTRITQQ